MAKRRAKNERADDSPRDDGRERARKLLARAKLECSPQATNVELADLLLLHLGRGDASWRDLALQLMLPTAELEAKALLLRDCYFLEGWKIAEETVARLLVDADVGNYARVNETPLARLRRAIRAAIVAHLTDPLFCIIPPPNGTGPEAQRLRIAHEIAKLANIADDLTRRVVWRTWVDRMDLRAAAASVGMPLEGAEQIMMRLGIHAHERIGRGDEYRAWLAERPVDGYPASEDDDEEQEFQEGAS
jgi:hypothetical protein